MYPADMGGDEKKLIFNPAARMHMCVCLFICSECKCVCMYLCMYGKLLLLHNFAEEYPILIFSFFLMTQLESLPCLKSRC